MRDCNRHNNGVLRGTEIFRRTFSVLAKFNHDKRHFGVPYIDGAYWSLLVELKFYLLVFLLVIAKQLCFAIWYLAGWLGISIAFRFVHIPGLNFFLFPDYSHYFISGALFFLISRDGPCQLKLAMILAAYVLAIFSALDVGANFATSFSEDFRAWILIVLITTFYAIFACISISRTSPFSAMRFATLGAMTYPFYLIHQNTGYILFQNLSETTNDVVLLCVAIAGALSVSWLINMAIEVRYGKRFKGALEGAAVRLGLT